MQYIQAITITTAAPIGLQSLVLSRCTLMDGYNQRASMICNTQAKAKQLATSIAKDQGPEVVIHGMNDKFREKNSFGHDPYPPRGYRSNT